MVSFKTVGLVVSGLALPATLAACSSSVNPTTGEKVAGIGTFSEGYRMGQLSKFSEKGLFKKSGEGTMMIGSDSTPYSVRVSEKETKTLNPWHFSADVEDASKFTPSIGENIWIRYNQAQVKSWYHDTDYMGQEIAPVTKVAAKSCSVPATQGGFQSSQGVRVGRVAKASFKGVFSGTKTWELIVQEGNSGNKFVEMSTEDEALYNCAVAWLKSGLPVKVSYTQVFAALSWNKTNYRVYAIAPAPSL